MTEKFQVSGKDNAGRIFVVGGDSYGEFLNNIGALTNDDPTAYVEELAAIIGATSGDPFAGAQQVAQQGLGATPAAPWQEQAPPPAYGQQQYEQQPRAAAPAPGSGPSCVHGPKKWVEGGVSRKTGRPYQGFWACAAPQGQQCAR